MVFVQMNTGDVSSKEILSALQHTYKNRWTWADLFPVNFEKHITHGCVATHNTAKAVVFSYVILWVCSVIAAADLIKCSSIWKSFCFSFFLSFKNIVPQNKYLADMEEAVQRAFWRVSTCVCRGSFSWTAFVASLGMSSHCCGKNSPWCTGWESQQQRRKLRPASQISSLSAAVLIRTDALVGPMFSSLEGYMLALPLAPSHNVQLRDARVLTRLLKSLGVSQSARCLGKTGGMSCRIQGRLRLLLSNFSLYLKP